ncbi:hypothetical protein T11_1029 [Trichinella zimbabwensis]|uniref:Uncharacterized protein n=1 Tax=Trichinella zimbabwensis TaxID=268475 RepID=A0A0V1DP43_9BILA|nr:hypothetical protein T11_1029 [Trichinella zimbabwensis]
MIHECQWNILHNEETSICAVKWNLKKFLHNAATL